MFQFDRRCSPRLPVSLLARLDLNGTEVDATARNISRGGAYIVCGTFLTVGANQRIRVEVLTVAGCFEIHGIVLGPRDALPASRPARRPARFGFAIRFDPPDFVLERIFASILDGIRVEAVSISLKIYGLAHVDGNADTTRDSPADRRVMPRVDIAFPAMVGTLRESVKAAQGTLVNLSATGACFEIHGDGQGLVDRLTLQILLPHLFQQEMSNSKAELGPVTAQIVWIKPVATGADGTQDPTARSRVGVRFLYYDAKGQRPIAGVVGQLLIASDQFDQLRAGGVITSEEVEFKNEPGQRIAGYLHNPNRALPGSPVVIISPGYGESKRAYVALGFYLAGNGFHVLRYDHCNHIGESDGESTKTTLSGFQRDLHAALTFAKKTLPESRIAVIASGLAGRVALKTAGSDPRIDLLLILSGVLDLQSACLSIHQEDLIVSFLRGSRRGVSKLMGLEIDIDEFLEDAIKGGYADLRTTLRDAREIHVPVMFFATPEEASGPLSTVNEVLAAIGPEELSKVFPIPQALEQLHEDPRKEWAMFRQLVSCCMAHFSPAGHRNLVEPSQVEIGRQNRLERQQAKTHPPMDTPAGLKLGPAYLDHFHCLSNIPEYWQLLDQILRHLGTMKTGATILDAGCGPGNLGTCMLLDDLYHRRGAFHSASERRHYVGMETDQSALSLARRHFSHLSQDSLLLGNQQGPPKIQMSLTRGDLTRPLPFRDHQFDRVICNLVLGYLEDPTFSLQELVRVLAPGGRILVTSLKPDADLIEIYRTFMLRTDLPEEVDQAEHLLNTACKIKQAENDGVFRSFHPHELAMLLLMSGAAEPRISSTFGEQAYLVVAQKQSRHEYHEDSPEQCSQDGVSEPDTAIVYMP
ncbi:MAG TPA: PilZ domain-containing protein [Nitrospirales bacterium]|jgi:SAM-dependent methyltransferase